jgi:hypothetical protein
MVRIVSEFRASRQRAGAAFRHRSVVAIAIVLAATMGAGLVIAATVTASARDCLVPAGWDVGGGDDLLRGRGECGADVLVREQAGQRQRPCP